MSNPAIEKRNSLTWWAGLSAGTGNVLSHRVISLEVKKAVWKRCRRHDGTHDFDTRAHDRRDSYAELVARWFKISSMISWGILGIMTDSVSTGVGCFASEVFESIQGVDRGRSDESY